MEEKKAGCMSARAAQPELDKLPQVWMGVSPSGQTPSSNALYVSRTAVLMRILMLVMGVEEVTSPPPLFARAAAVEPHALSQKSGWFEPRSDAVIDCMRNHAGMATSVAVIAHLHATVALPEDDDDADGRGNGSGPGARDSVANAADAEDKDGADAPSASTSASASSHPWEKNEKGSIIARPTCGVTERVPAYGGACVYRRGAKPVTAVSPRTTSEVTTEELPKPGAMGTPGKYVGLFQGAKVEAKDHVAVKLRVTLAE